jgi:hypothetical protein
MRAVSPLIVLVVVLSWTLPEAAGAKTPIPALDGVVRETAPTASDPVQKVRDEIEGARDITSSVVERVLTPPPDVVVTTAPTVASTPPQDVVDSSPRRSARRRSDAGARKARTRSPTRRHKDRVGSSNRQDRDTRQPDKRDDLYRVAAAGNEIHPTEVKGLTLTAGRRSLLAATGVYLLTWIAAALFLIGLGALSLLSSRPRFARFSLRA